MADYVIPTLALRRWVIALWVAAQHAAEARALVDATATQDRA